MKSTVMFQLEKKIIPYESTTSYVKKKIIAFTDASPRIAANLLKEDIIAQAAFKLSWNLTSSEQ